MVVNWNTAAAALSAARAHRASEDVAVRVTLVDNASREEERARLRAGAGSDVDLRLLGANLGYGAAANLALAGTDAELVCVANADLVPDPRMHAILAQTAAREPRAGILAPRLAGATRRLHARLPSARSLPLRAFAPGLAHRPLADPPPGVIAEVEQPAGACIVLRRAVWQALGGFDPAFFLWFEDVDLAARALAAGYRNLVVGAAVAHHAGAAAFDQLDENERQRIRLESLERYVAKHHPGQRRLTHAAVAGARPLRRWEAALTSSLRRRRRAH